MIKKKQKTGNGTGVIVLPFLKKTDTLQKVTGSYKE